MDASGDKENPVLKLAYIATPYSHPDPTVRHDRYVASCLAAKAVAERGEYAAYSPIAHWHPIAITYKLPTDAQFWKNQNEGVIMAADVVIVVKIDGWTSSVGVEMEIRFAHRNGKKVIYMEAV